MNESQIAVMNDLQKNQQILTFQVNDENFGIEILKVKELMEYSSITKVPLVPDHIRGVINLRGKVIPVIDLHFIFSGKAAETTKKTCIIIAESNDNEKAGTAGILVDNVNEVLDVSDRDIEPTIDFGTAYNSSFILGMAKIKENIIILLDMDYVLSLGQTATPGAFDTSFFRHLQAV